MQADRFVASSVDKTLPLTASQPAYYLARAMGLSKARRFAFGEQRTNTIHEDSESLHSIRKSLNKKLYEEPRRPSQTSATTNLQATPVMTLSAPGMMDDFYSRPVAWSRSGVIAVATKHSVNYRNMHTGDVGCVASLVSLDRPTCLEWSPSSDVLALGLDWGDVRLYDIRTQMITLDLSGLSYIGGLSWNGEHMITLATESGSIQHYDTRISGRQQCALHTPGHNSRVCGVKWNDDQRYLASGSGDGSVMLWDARARKGLELFGEFNEAMEVYLNEPRGPEITPPTPPSTCILERRWRQKQHTSTVKALAWCPWQSDLLASGGGTRDGTIRLWSASSGNCKKIIKTRSQVSSLHFSHSCREIVSTHGYAFANLDPSSRIPGMPFPTPPRGYSLLVHSVVSGEVAGRVMDLGHGRVSDSAMGPDGTCIVTCGADETIRMYKVFGEQTKVEDDRETLWQHNIIR